MPVCAVRRKAKPVMTVWWFGAIAIIRFTIAVWRCGSGRIIDARCVSRLVVRKNLLIKKFFITGLACSTDGQMNIRIYPIVLLVLYKVESGGRPFNRYFYSRQLYYGSLSVISEFSRRYLNF